MKPLRIHLVEGGTIVEALGSSEDMVSLVPLLLDQVQPERVTFALHKGACALLWSSTKAKK